MQIGISFVLNSIVFGTGLAMDAFTVSVADGLAEPGMRNGKKTAVAGTFAFFQFLMPLAGWAGVHFLVERFKSFSKVVPWIALVLLLYIGGDMLLSALKKSRQGGEEDPETKLLSGKLTFSVLMLQGVATSIDALSVGFTVSDYGFVMALVCSLIIGLTTFAICIAGLVIGKHFGKRFGEKAEIAGGIILILIGAEIFINGVILR